MRNFRFGMKAISNVEKKLKKPIAKIDFDSLTMEDTAILIWAGLAHEDKNLTPDRVMDLVDEYSDLATVMEALGEAFTGAFGSVDEAAVEGKNE